MNNGIANVDGKFYKKCKVIMLPTEKESQIVKNKHGKLFYSEQNHSYSDTTNQHLYILSDQEIKEGDYFINVNAICRDGKDFASILVLKASNYDAKTIKSQKFTSCKKIIATTDSELNTKTERIKLSTEYKEYSVNLFSTPSDAFIKKYCELGGIDEVLVEYEMWAHTESDPQYKLKVSPDNTITIKPVKDSWNRNELIQLFSEYRLYSQADNSECGLNKWIEENL